MLYPSAGRASSDRSLHYADEIIRNRDRVPERKTVAILRRSRGNFRQLPHPRHKRRIFRTLHQKNGSVPPAKRIANFTMILPRSLCWTVESPLGRAQARYRTYGTSRLARQTNSGTQFHHGLIGNRNLLRPNLSRRRMANHATNGRADDPFPGRGQRHQLNSSVQLGLVQTVLTMTGSPS